MSKQPLLSAIVFVIALACVVSAAVSAEKYPRFKVEGWEIVGVWQQNYGIDVQTVIERSGNEYRIRWVSSDDPKSQKSTAPMKRSGDTYTRVGSTHGDYYKVLANGEIACYDSEGFIENMKPV